MFFNRGVTAEPGLRATEFGNMPPDKQPTPKKRAEAYAWLSRDLDEAHHRLHQIREAGDAIRGCFYEFATSPCSTR